MRQVPARDAAPLGIVGSGRVARHFRHYFELLGLPIRTWSRQVSATSPTDALAPCETILILIRDAAIVPFIETWPALQEKRLVHCSGSLVTPLAQGAHPLMTFGQELYELADFCFSGCFSTPLYVVEACAPPSLSQESPRVSAPIRHRRRLPTVSGGEPLAGRIRV